MQAAPLPPDEAGRLAALDRLGILYSPAEERFDRITRLACRLFEAPISLISLVAEKSQWFKSRQGFDLAGTPRELAFCAHAILDDEPFIVEDATKDERFRDNPLVTGEPHIRSYAGVVLRDISGHRLGTLCVIGREPRSVKEGEVDLLKDLGGWAENELHMSQFGEVQKQLLSELDTTRREARIDPLTQAWNRRALGEILERELARSNRTGQAVSLVMLDLDHFKLVNDRHGHDRGDAVLRESARRMRSRLRVEDALCRYGGEEFVAVLSNCELPKAGVVAEKIRERMASEPFAVDGLDLPLTASFGVAEYRSGSGKGANELVQQADAALYEAKRRGRNRVELG